MKFQKKAIIIEAVQWKGTKDSWNELQKFGMSHTDWKPGPTGTDSFIIVTSEGDMTVSKGDWVIKEPFDKERKFYPCKDDIFRQTYEALEDVDDEEEPPMIIHYDWSCPDDKCRTRRFDDSAWLQGEGDSKVMKCLRCGNR